MRSDELNVEESARTGWMLTAHIVAHYSEDSGSWQNMQVVLSPSSTMSCIKTVEYGISMTCKSSWCFSIHTTPSRQMIQHNWVTHLWEWLITVSMLTMSWTLVPRSKKDLQEKDLKWDNDQWSTWPWYILVWNDWCCSCTIRRWWFNENLTVQSHSLRSMFLGNTRWLPVPRACWARWNPYPWKST